MVPSGTLTTGDASSDWCPKGLTVAYYLPEQNVLPPLGGKYSSAAVGYLNQLAPQPIETNIVFLPKQQTPVGDANMDGHVDINDLTILLSNYGQSSTNSNAVGWGKGDFNGDGKVDINDLTILLASYGTTYYSSSGSALVAVPEPSGVTLVFAMAIGLAGVAARLARRKGHRPVGPSCDRSALRRM